MRQLFNSSSKGKVSIKGNLGQFMRLAPMPFPTFGEVKLDTLAVGVPIEQIYPAWASFMSGKDYQLGSGGSYYPVKLPFITNQQITIMLYGLFGTQKFYLSDQSANNPSKIPAKIVKNDSSFDSIEFSNLNLLDFDVLLSEARKIYDSSVLKVADDYHDVKLSDGSTIVFSVPTLTIFFDYFEGRISLDYTRELLGYPVSSAHVAKRVVAQADPSLDEIYAAAMSADYVSVSGTGFTVYKLSSKGKALRKVLIGLGYNLSMDDLTEMSVLPLLACYKAYFDNFFPNRGIDWMATKCHQVVSYIGERNCVDLVSDPNMVPLFKQFLQQELSSMYSTHAMDFISLHTNNVSNGSNPFKENVGVPNSYESGISWQQEASYKPTVSSTGAGSNPITYNTIFINVLLQSKYKLNRP